MLATALPGFLVGATLVATGMALDPHKGYRSLLRGRTSQAGSEYFLTFCTEHRHGNLAAPELAPSILAEIHEMETDGVWSFRCVVIMPDHLHLLIRLADKLTLGKAVARLKGKSGSVLKAAGMRWQDGYYDHHMRPNEDRLPVFLYLYLNPYRAGLLPPGKTWPWFVCSEEDRSWFRPMLNEGLPEPAWLTNLP